MVLHGSRTAPSIRRPIDHLRWMDRKKGLLEIGYHLILDKEGGSHLIRPIDSIGCHTPGFNHNSIGVCLIGGVDEEGEPERNFTETQYLSVVRWAAAFMVSYPRGRVVGRSEIQKIKGRPGACPPVDMEAIRTNIQHEWTAGVYKDLPRLIGVGAPLRRRGRDFDGENQPASRIGP